VSFMYESLVLSYGQIKEFRGRITMILLAALITGMMGIFGWPQLIVDSIGKDIFLGMLAGVGLYLAKVGIDIAKYDVKIGFPCLILAIATQILTNDLVLTVAVSVPAGILMNRLYRNKIKIKQKVIYKSWKDMFKKEMKIIRPIFNRKVFVGALALSTLTIGGNIAYTAANSQISHTPATYNKSTIISGMADFASSLFGGANMELIITPTAAAPHPVLAAVGFMLLASIILISGAVYKIARYIPLSAMGGYLFVIGGMLILPYNAQEAFNSGNVVTVGLTMTVTLFSNPFYGLMAGALVKLVIS
jgi:adenine/guanine/hypoxanthine permease